MTTSIQTSVVDGCAVQSSGPEEITSHITRMNTKKGYNPLDTGFMPVYVDNTPSTSWSISNGNESRVLSNNNSRRMSAGSDTTMESPNHSSAGSSPIDNALITTPDHLHHNPTFSHSNHNLISPLNKHSTSLGTSSLTDQQYFTGGASSYKEFIPNSKPTSLFGLGIADNIPQSGKFKVLYTPSNFPMTTNMPVYSPATNNRVDYWDNFVYTVQFKRSHRYYLLPKAIPGVFSIGTFVKVEADRGEDLGVIIEKIEFEKLRTGNVRTRLQNGELKSILYPATVAELAQLKCKSEEERAIVHIATERMQWFGGCTLKIVDADYQFDRHKLTIYYESNQRIDFRDFVRDLFTIYKTRIWMEHVTYSFRPNEAAAIALQTGENMNNVTVMGMVRENATPQYGAAPVYPAAATNGVSIGHYGVPKTPTFSAAPAFFAGARDPYVKNVAPVSHVVHPKNVMPHTFANESFIQPRNLNQYNNFNLE